MNHWRTPYRSSLPLLRRAVAVELEGNEFLFASYASTLLAECRFCMGTELSRAYAECEASLVFTRKIGHRVMAGIVTAHAC